MSTRLENALKQQRPQENVSHLEQQKQEEISRYKDRINSSGFLTINEKLSLDQFKELAKGLEENANLNKITSFSLNNSSLGNHDWENVGNFLKKMPNIERVDLSKNDIGENGMYALKDSLSNNQNITELSMNRCRLGNKECYWLQDVLKDNLEIRKLYLNHNNIGGEGLDRLADGLSSRIGPSEPAVGIDLSRNPVTSYEAEEVEEKYKEIISYISIED